MQRCDKSCSDSEDPRPETDALSGARLFCSADSTGCDNMLEIELMMEGTSKMCGISPLRLKARKRTESGQEAGTPSQRVMITWAPSCSEFVRLALVSENTSLQFQAINFRYTPAIFEGLWPRRRGFIELDGPPRRPKGDFDGLVVVQIVA